MFKRPSRRVSRVFIHCSASDHRAHDNAATLDRWHKERGWAGIGYHYFIRKNGLIERGRNINRTPAAQGGNNTGTIAICLHGLHKNRFTQAQFRSLRKLCSEIDAAYRGNITFHGHCEVSAKTCPVFDYTSVLGLDGEGALGWQVAAASGTIDDVPVAQLPGDIAGKPALRSKTVMASTALTAISTGAAVTAAGREIADNTASITRSVGDPVILVAGLAVVTALGLGGFIIWDRVQKGKEKGA